MRKSGKGVALLVGWLALGGLPTPSEAGGVAKVSDSGEFIELSHDAEGRTVVDRLSLYRSGNVRYFSAGVGVEERMADYPPFSLKIVLTAGGKPFLAGASVTIRPAKGGSPLTIPREQVEGPWLFVDLPAGVYEVTAMHGDRAQRLKSVKVEAGKQHVVYLRWNEDPGIPANLPVD